MLNVLALYKITVQSVVVDMVFLVVAETCVVLLRALGVGGRGRRRCLVVARGC